MPRHFPMRTPWLLLMGGGLLFTVCGVVLAVASSWVLAGGSWLIAAAAVAGALDHRRRLITIDEHAIAIPAEMWRRRRTEIRFERITALGLRRFREQDWVIIDHVDGQAGFSRGMVGDQAFGEISQLLGDRVLAR